MKSPERKSLINGWTISLLIVTSGVVIILAGIFYYNSEEKSIRQEKYNELKAIAGLKTEQLQQWRSDRLMDANVTQSVFFGKAIADFASGDSTAALKQNLIHRLNQYHELYMYEQAIIVLPDGRPILFMNNKNSLLDSVTKAELKIKANETESSYSDVYFSENNKRFQLDIYAPVIIDNSIKARLILQIDPEIFLFPLIQSWPTPSKSAETMLVKKDGDNVLFINELRHRKNTALNLRLPLTDTAYAAVQAMMGRTGIYDGKDYRGVQVIADLRKIEGTNWFMITKIDKSELFDELYYRAKLVSGLSLLIILLLVTGLILIYNYRQRKIYADLYRAEKILADTEDEFRTTLSSINDAVVICNKDGHIQSMNNNAEMITGWQESEVLGKNVSELLQIMDAESRERIENPLHHLLFKQENKLISKYNLVSRKNEEIPITISAAKISSSNRKISGIILSFKDQTTAREAELKLRYSEEVFSKLFQLGTFPTALIRLSDLRIMDVNQSLNDTLGYSKEEIVGKKLDELKIWKTLDRLDSFIESLKEDGTINNYEFKFVTEDGQDRIGLIFARIIDLHKDKFMITRIMDITEQKLSEQALKESEQLYRSLFEGMTNGYAYCKLLLSEDAPADFEVIKVNGVFYSLTGFPPVEGKRISEILPGIQNQDPAVFELLRNFVANGAPVQFEYHLEQIDQWFRLNAYLPSPGYMVVLFDVITEKKKAELAVAESEKRYRSVLENMMESCQILSPDWRYLYLNETACNIARFPREEMLGKKVSDFFYDFESTEMFAVLNQCMTERISMRREFEFDFHDGRIGWFEFSIQPVQEGIFILGLDITERKLALEKIEAQYSLLTSLINSPSNMNIFTLDRDYRYTSFNHNHANQIKQFLKLEISIGMSLLDCFPAEFAKVAKERIDKVFNGETYNEVINLPDSDFSYEVSWNPIINGGQITGITVFSTDISERIKAQEAVLAAQKKIETSETQYRLLAERMVDVVGVMNLNTMQFQYISPSIEQLLGYTVDEVMNGPMKTILSPANKDKINTKMLESIDLMKKGEVNSVHFIEEIEQIKKDGSFIWTEVATSLAFNEKGEIELTGIIRDISERKKNEEQLKASEERFRQLLELVPYPLGYVDKFGTIVFRNEKFSHTLGYSFEDIPTMKEWWITAFPDPAYRSEAMTLWNSLAQEAVATGNSIPSREYRLLCKSGEFRNFEISGIEYAEGLLATFIDVTDRKRNESFERLGHTILKELNENKNTETMLTNIARQIKKHTGIDAVGIRLKNGLEYPYISALGFNDKFLRNEKHLCTYDKDGVIVNDDGNPVLDCICGSIIKKSYNPNSPCFTEGGSFYSNTIQEWQKAASELPNADKRKNSPCRTSGYESIALIPIHSGSETLGLIQLNDKNSNTFKEGTIPYFESLGASIGLAIVRNQAQGELLRINQELDQRVKERTAQLQAANTELESFSYSVSHDLRAPLRHIGGFAQILKTEYKPELPEKAQHYLNTIDHSVKIMGTLIDDLLQFSRTGRADVKKKEIAMDAVFDEALGQVLSQAVGREIKWDIKPLPKVMADENLIKQVWANLLSNAIKYSKTKDITEISVGYTEKEMEYHFYIKDNGIGFDMKYVHKLFGVFQRLHSADIFEGTGIGLANVRRIVSRHGGNTWAEGVVDQGATFYFSLPKT